MRPVHLKYVTVVLVAWAVLYQIKAAVYDLSVESQSQLNEDAPLGRESTGQKIVLLPGPHKTGTSSVQVALKGWIGKRPAGTEFYKWAYPVLTAEEWQSVETDERMFVDAKGFHPFFHSLLSNSCSDATSSSNSTSLVRQYSKKLQQKWDAGFSLLLASESLDLLVNEQAAMQNGDYANQYWERALGCLPKIPLDVPRPPIVVGIQHRTPRVDHLISLWHQIGGNRTLLDFATDLNTVEPHSSVLNSLGLAAFFAQRGYPVVILDTGGMAASEEKVKLPIAAACYFLQMPCHRNKRGELGITRTEQSDSSKSTFVRATQNKNEREDKAERGITEQTLTTINNLLLDFDCQYKSLVHLKNVNLLYGNSTFSRCQHELTGAKPEPIYKTIRAIAEFLCKEYPTSKNCQPT